jgi:hypothetical protein
VRTDAGLTYAVAIPAGARLLRVAPGDKDLSNAQKIAASDVGVGDRVLVRLAAGATIPFDATSVIDIPHAAIVAKQREEQMAWQRHGVGGLVKSVDAANGVIVITSGTGAAAKEETLKVTPATVLRRYAPDSVDYARATAAPISAIRPGDQLRALLAPDTAGPDKTVREAVSGSFRNIAGKISSVNAKDQTITLRDLMTKKNVTVHIGPTSQMKKLTDEQAKLIAASTTAPGTPGATHAPLPDERASAHGIRSVSPRTDSPSVSSAPLRHRQSPVAIAAAPVAPSQSIPRSLLSTPRLASRAKKETPHVPATSPEAHLRS